jgi:hypothetical protein
LVDGKRDFGMADESWQGDVSVFAFDVVGYSARSNADQLKIARTTQECLEKAGDKAEEIRQREWTSWADAGDGGYLLMSGDPRKALEVLEAFVGLIESDNLTRLAQYHIELRYALNYGSVYRENGRLTGNAINDCARLLDGMKKYTEPTGRVVASGSYKSKVLEFGQVPEGLFARLADIEDKRKQAHEVWNVRKLPGYGREPAPEDLHDPR